jgi:hypothetical protein
LKRIRTQPLKFNLKLKFKKSQRKKLRLLKKSPQSLSQLKLI